MKEDHMKVHSTLARRGGTGALAITLLLGTGLGAAEPARATAPECATDAGAVPDRVDRPANPSRGGTHEP